MSDTTPTSGDTGDTPEAVDPVSDGEGPPAKPKRIKRTAHWSKRRRRLTWTGIITAIVIVILVGGTYGYAIYRNDQIHHIAVKNLTKIPKTGVENILMIGSTSRCALKVQNAAFGLCSQGVDGVNGDVIMLLHLNPTKHRVSILSFPRDTFLPNARPDQNNRIDSALVYGPSQLVKVVEQDFGIPVNHFVVLNFDSFQGVVNALGGIDMYFPDPVKDAYSTLNVKETGCDHLNGFEALAVVRARHMQYKVDGKWLYDGSGDLGRIVRDHEFLRVLADQLAKRSLGNPVTDNAIFSAIAPQLEVDNGFNLHEIVDLVLTYHGIDANDAPELTLPVTVDPSFSYMYEGYNYGSIVFPTEPQDLAAIASFSKQKIVNKKIKPASITVAVEGGMDSPSATATTAAQLKALGYNVMSTTEVQSVGPVSETQVLYKAGELSDGERVLASFHGAVALGESNTAGGADVTIVTGSNFGIAKPVVVAPTSTKKSSGSSKTKPSTSTTTSTTIATTTTTSPVATASNSNLEAPTAARATLPSYDPRACTAAQIKKLGK